MDPTADDFDAVSFLRDALNGDPTLFAEQASRLSADQMQKVREELNPMARTIPGAEGKFMSLSLVNLSEQFMRRELMTSLVGFAFRACDEYELKDDEKLVPVDELELDVGKSVETVVAEARAAADAANEAARVAQEAITLQKSVESTVKKAAADAADTDEITPVGDSTDSAVPVVSPAVELAIKNATHEAQEAVKLAAQTAKTSALSAEKAARSAEQLANAAARTYSNDVRRSIVHEFLTSLFEFNPDKHVRSAYSINKGGADTERKNLSVKRGVPVPPPETGEQAYDDAMRHVPAADVFHKFRMYCDSNYQQLRDATVDLYADKPDLEFAIQPFAEHKDEEDAKKFINKYRNRVTCDIRMCHSGQWNLAGPFTKNRERIAYYNDKTRVLEEMMAQQERDARLGAELMSKRIVRKKRENVAAEGEDASGLASYKSNMGKTTSDRVDPTEKHLVDYAGADSDPAIAEALEVPVFRISEGGAKLERDVIYTESMPPEQ
jgi:hypothetical protein